MSLKMFHVLVSSLLFTASISGVLGIPFLTEESANQFIRLKRHLPYSENYWDASSSQNTWGYAVIEQVSESWTALRDTAKYYMDLKSFAFDPLITRGSQGKQAYTAYAEIWFRDHICKGKYLQKMANMKTKVADRIFNDNVRPYMDMLQQSGTHLQQQTRTSS